MAWTRTGLLCQTQGLVATNQQGSYLHCADHPLDVCALGVPLLTDLWDMNGKLTPAGVASMVVQSIIRGCLEISVGSLLKYLPSEQFFQSSKHRVGFEVRALSDHKKHKSITNLFAEG